MRFWVIAITASLAAGGAIAKPHKRHKPAAEKPAAETAPAPRDVNGSWTVESETTVGSCPQFIPSALTIADNKIAGASGAEVATWGYVDEDGNIVGRFTAKGEGEHVARFHCALKGGKGSGAWSSSTDMCGGTWRAAQQ
jgi:hypothetical protein